MTLFLSLCLSSLSHAQGTPNFPVQAVDGLRGNLGVAFRFQASFLGGTAVFSPSNLPPGLTVNRTNGLITGTPIAAGYFTSSITASNANGVASLPLNFTIPGTRLALPLNDNFSASVANRYMPYRLFSGPGSMRVSNGVARFESPAVGADQCSAGLLLNLPLSLTSSWDISADVFLPNGWSTPEAEIGLSLSPMIRTNDTVETVLAQGNEISLVLNRDTDLEGGNNVRQSVCIGSMDSDQPDLRTTINNNQVTSARVRFVYQAASRSVRAWVQTNPASRWVPVGAALDMNPATHGSVAKRWGLSSGSSLCLTLSAYAEGGTGGKTIGLDNLSIGLPVLPVISSTTNLVGRVGQSLSYQIAANNGPVSFGAANLPSGLSLNQDTGLISGTPTQAGAFANIVLTAISPAGSVNRTISGVISPSVPVVSSLPPSPGSLVLSNLYTNVLRVMVNPEGQNTNRYPITYGAVGLPAGLSIAPGTGLVSGRPTVAGIYRTRLTAGNITGTGSLDVDLAVETVAGGPRFASGDAVNYRVNFPGALSYSALGLPAGLSINPTTGLITGTAGGIGTNNFTVTARGPGNLTYSTNLSLVFTAPGAATLSLTKSAAPGPNASLRATVSGLLKKQNVRLSVYWDANGNGQLDAGEPMGCCYDVPNGGDYKIGNTSIRNPIRPWDLDGVANNTVQAELADGRQTIWGELVGNFVVRVSDPAPSPTFSPAQAVLNMELPAKAQMVSGTLTNTAGEPLGGSVVYLQHLDSAAQYVVFTRTNGTWSAPLEPGDYNLAYHVLTRGNYETPTAGQSTFTLAAGQNLEINGTAEKVSIPRILQGTAVDTAGNPLRGVIIEARQGETRSALCFTDENGAFSLLLDPGVWSLKVSPITVASLGLVAYGSALAPSFDLSSGNQTGLRPILATRVNSMLTGTVTNSLNKNLKGLSLSIDTSAYLADHRIESGGRFCMTWVGGPCRVDVSKDDCARLGMIPPEEDVILDFPPSGTKDMGRVGLDAGTLKIKGRFVDTEGNPVEGMTVVAKRWGQTSGKPAAESQTRGGGYFAAWVLHSENYSLTQYGSAERTPTHIFLPVALPRSGPGTNNFGNVICFPLDEFVEVTPVNGADGSSLQGDVLDRATRPAMWTTVDFQEDRGVLWGLSEMVKRGQPDALRLNDTETLSQIRAACHSQLIDEYFRTNSAATSFPVSLPGGVNVALGKSDWETNISEGNWNLTNEAINLPSALQMSIPSQDGVYRLPITRALSDHPAVNYSNTFPYAFHYGFSYDGDTASLNRVLGQWRGWPVSDSNSITYFIREVQTNRAIRVQYLTKDNKPVPFRWLGYGIWEYSDANEWGTSGVEYSGGATTDANGFVNLPAYASWSDWRVTDWAEYPQPEGGIRVGSAVSTNLVLRQYGSKRVTGLGSFNVGPGGILRVIGQNLDQVGASWLARARIVPATENSNSPRQGISLNIVARTQNSFDVAIPGYMKPGSYKIRLDNDLGYLYSPAFTISGNPNVAVAKVSSNQISVTASNLISGYGFWHPSLVLSNSLGSLTSLKLIRADSAHTATFEPYSDVPEGNAQLWFHIWDFDSDSQFGWGPFGNLSFP